MPFDEYDSVRLKKTSNPNVFMAFDEVRRSIDGAWWYTDKDNRCSSKFISRREFDDYLKVLEQEVLTGELGNV